MNRLLRTLALGAAVTAAAVSATDQVLVLSAQKQLLHTAPPSAESASFSSAGLAELAMDALGLGSGTVASAPSAAARSPLQADIFTSANAYALVFVQDDGAVLDAIAASTTFPADAYYSVFPVTSQHDSASRKVPQAIAREFAAAIGANGAVQCAGSPSICATTRQTTVTADAALVQRVLNANAFLHGNVDADVTFARELAAVHELTTSLSSSAADATAKRALFVVGLSSVDALDSSKHSAGRQALTAHVGAFLSALQLRYSAAGAQVVAARDVDASVVSSRPAAAMTQLNAVTSYSRLLSSLATAAGSADADASGSDDSDDDESDDDEAGVAANGTRSSNATSLEKVSLEAIAEYQIVLWTSVLLVVTLLLVILAMCNMNTGRDSLLYAKFITDANHRKSD